MLAVVRASLRGFRAADGRNRDYSLHWWSVDPAKYVRDDKLRKAVREVDGKASAPKLPRQAKPSKAAQPMSLSEAISSGTITESEAAMLSRFAVSGNN